MAKTGVKKDNKTLDIKTVCECCHCLGSKTLHPQVSLINLEKPELEEELYFLFLSQGRGVTPLPARDFHGDLSVGAYRRRTAPSD